MFHHINIPKLANICETSFKVLNISIVILDNLNAIEWDIVV